MVRETMTEFAMRDVLGRGRSKGGSEPGSFSRIIADAIGASQTKAEAESLTRLAAWFRSVRAWLRGVLGTVQQVQKSWGKEGAQDWEQHMEKLLGMSEMGRYEGGLRDDIEGEGELANTLPGTEQEADMTLSVTPRNYAEAVDAALAGKLPPNAVLDMGMAGAELQAAGLPALPLRVRQSRIRKKTTKHHELTREVMTALPRAMQRPALVYVSPEDGKAHALVTTIPTSKGPITGYFTVRADSSGAPVLDAKSIFGKDPGEILAEVRRVKEAGGTVHVNEQALNELLATQVRGVLSETSRQHQLAVEGLNSLLGSDSESQGESLSGGAGVQGAQETVEGDGMLESERSYSLTPLKPAKFIQNRWNQRIDDWEKTGEAGRDPIHLGVTPPALQMAGADKLPLLVPPSIFSKVTKDVHAVPLDVLRSLPEFLANPLAVFQSRRDGDAVLSLTTEAEPGKGPIVIAIHLGKDIGRSMKANVVTSVYGRPESDVAAMFNEQPLYIDEGRRPAWARRAGKQYPGRGTPKQDRSSIPGPDDVVKRFSQAAHTPLPDPPQ
jgi:hypothetical protein